jgi:SAM-dependent methyltransferase
MGQAAEQLSPSMDVATAVRQFYDRFPYPPPVRDLEKYRQRWQDQQKRRAEFRLFWPGRAYWENRSILVAGCGTSQAAKHALRWPQARVTGIDVSTTSVRCTRELKRNYNLQNLEVHELALEQVGDLGRKFDQIICTGVLHHLADPDAGLRALRSVLDPDGAIELMVYAPYGRTGIYMLQEFCRRTGVQAGDGEIRDLMRALSALPSGHPLQELLSRAPDFRNEAALADALLHPQDRAYSVPQLLALIDKAGLAFGRWVKQAPYCVHCGVLSRIPQAKRIERLSAEDQYAAIELFRGTMIRHSVIVYDPESASLEQQVRLRAGASPSDVPVRMANTICVQSPLPPGAAGVLINRSHTYTDLILPISRMEKMWLDTMDGFRSISEVAKICTSHSSPKTDLDSACSFFDRLWRYDQVAFDTSSAGQRSIPR